MPVFMRYCEKAGRRTVKMHENGFAVTVELKEGRVQTVYVTPIKRKDGIRLLRVYSYCGEPSPDVVQWVMGSNAKLIYCAFAVKQVDGQERLMLSGNLDRSEATPRMVKAAVKEIAFYSDWLEQKTTGADVF